MVRTPGFQKNGMKKGSWSQEEDNKLRAYVGIVQKYGRWNWRELPKYAGLARCGKSCRLRWVNYLKPGVKRGNYTEEEEDLIMRLYEELGTRWSAIARRLPGRTDNDIKNHWHTHLKKRMRKNWTNCKVIEQPIGAPKLVANYKDQYSESLPLEANQKHELASLESLPFPSELSFTGLNCEAPETMGDAQSQQTSQSFIASREQCLGEISTFSKSPDPLLSCINWAPLAEEYIVDEALEYIVDAQNQQTLQNFNASLELCFNEFSALTTTDYELSSFINWAPEAEIIASLISFEASNDKIQEAQACNVDAKYPQISQSFGTSPEQCFNENFSLTNSDYALSSCINWEEDYSLALQESYVEPFTEFWATFPTSNILYDQNVYTAPAAEIMAYSSTIMSRNCDENNF